MKDNKKKGSKVPFYISISVLVLLVGSYFLVSPVREFVNEGYDVLTSDDDKAVKEWVSQFGVKGPVVLIVLMIAQMFLFVVPNILLMMISILSYGPIWGSLLAWFGVFASSTVGYFIGRKIGQPALYYFLSEKTEKKMEAFVNDYSMGAIFLTRLSSFSNDALSFVAGALEMNYFKYIACTLGGIAPLITLLAIYGRNGKIEKALLWISIVSLGLLASYIIIDKRKKRQRGD